MGTCGMLGTQRQMQRLTLGRGVGWSGVAGKETISWLDAGGMTVRGGGDAAWSPAVMK